MSGTWASGWVSGDIVTAAELAKGTGVIDRGTVTVAAASVTASSILGSYSFLRLTLLARGDDAASNVLVGVRFNGDTGANYYSQLGQARAGTAEGADESLAGTSLRVGRIVAAAAPASAASVIVVTVPFYAETTFHQPVESRWTAHRATTTSDTLAGYGAGIWKNAAAITSLTVLALSGNFAVGTKWILEAGGA